MRLEKKIKMHLPRWLLRTIAEKQTQMRALFVDYWERLQYVWTPKNAVDDDTQERRLKRLWMMVKRLLLSYVGLIALLLLLSPLVGSWLLQWFSTSITQAATQSTAMEIAPELNIWITNERELETGLIAPPYSSFELYKQTSHICLVAPAFVRLVGENSSSSSSSISATLPVDMQSSTVAPRIHELYNVFYHNERDRRFVSLYAIAKAMLNTYRGSVDITNVLCTYMFGNWSALAAPLPCFCISMAKASTSNTPNMIADDSVSGAIFMPQIKRQSESAVRARVYNVMGFVSPFETSAMPDANVNTFVRLLPKFIETSFDHMALSRTTQQQQQQQQHSTAATHQHSHHQQQPTFKSIDQRANRLRQYTPIDMAHTSMTVVTVNEVNMWMTMCSALRLNLAIHTLSEELERDDSGSATPVLPVA
jgi:hypothetical protein